MKRINIKPGEYAELAFIGLSPAASAHMLALARKTANNAKTLIQRTQGLGRIYRRGKTIYHQASRPGQPPVTDSGTLVSNIFADRLGSNAAAGVPLRPRIPGAIAGNANRKMLYAHRLEYKMRRQWLRPAGNAAINSVRFDPKTLKLKKRRK